MTTTTRRRNEDDEDDNNSRESSPSSTLLDPALLRNISPASSSKPLSKRRRGQKSYYTVDDVSKHDRENDCWVIVHDRVYDVTTFVPKHPRGEHDSRERRRGMHGLV